MKFTVIRSHFLEALQLVQNIVQARPALQITSNCLISAEGGQLVLTTTDLDLSAKSILTQDVEITTEGATTLPVKRLVSIVRALPEGQITFDIDNDDVARVDCGATFFRLIGMAAKDFPPISEPAADARSFTIDQGIFKEMLRKTSYATSKDETRKVLTGVLMQFNDAKLTMVATDGKRLALVEQELEFPPEDACEMVLPPKTVSELLRLLGSEGPLKIYKQPTQAVFACDAFELSSKLIDGIYAKYQQVIPTKCDERVTIERELLNSALGRVSLMAAEKTGGAKLTFAENQLTIMVQSSDVGEARETIAVKYSGPEMQALYNPTFITECLNSLDTDEVVFELSEGHSPAVIKSNDLPFLYVLMPLRLGK